MIVASGFLPAFMRPGGSFALTYSTFDGTPAWWTVPGACARGGTAEDEAGTDGGSASRLGFAPMLFASFAQLLSGVIFTAFRFLWWCLSPPLRRSGEGVGDRSQGKEIRWEL